MMRVQPKGNWFFPVSLALLLGGVSFWLDRITDVKTVEIPLSPNEPKYEIKSIEGERFDTAGRRSETITAQRAWQFPQQTVIHIARPTLLLYDQGRLLYSLKADEALYHSDNKQVDLMRNVMWHKNSRGDEPEASLQTSKLWVDTQTQVVKTNAPVQYQYGLSHGSANGFEYSKTHKFLNLPSRVKAIIYDPKKPSS